MNVYKIVIHSELDEIVGVEHYSNGQKYEHGRSASQYVLLMEDEALAWNLFYAISLAIDRDS